MSDEVLELETRREIYDLIGSDQGLHMREISRRLEMSISLVEYHLNHLESAEIVTAVEEGGYKRYFPIGRDEDGHVLPVGGDERRMISVLRQPIPLRVTLFLLKEKQATNTEIAIGLDISPSRFSFHLKKLTGTGIVRKLRRAEGKGYTLVDEDKTIRLLVIHRPSMDMLDEVAELWDSLDPMH